MTTNPVPDRPVEPTEEIWVFGGTRRLDGKRYHAWLPPGIDLDHALYFRPAGSHVPGSEYVVRVTREGGTVTTRGMPTYHGRHDNDAVRARLEAAHRAAETQLRLAAMERNDKRHSALDELVDPLCDLIRSASTAYRDALITYILRRLTWAW